MVYATRRIREMDLLANEKTFFIATNIYHCTSQAKPNRSASEKQKHFNFTLSHVQFLELIKRDGEIRMSNWAVQISWRQQRLGEKAA